MVSLSVSSSFRWVSRFAVILILALALVSVAWASEKKGVGLANLNWPERIEALNVAWYYTWKPHPVNGAPPEKFVPMLSGGRGGGRFGKDIEYLKTQPKAPILLTFNEPNKQRHGNKTPDEVIKLWPQVEKLGEMIGSPAPAGLFRPWWDEFYKKAKALNLKVDFMAVHKYGPPDASRFIRQIDAVYERYKMPIWITEFAVADWSSKGKVGANKYTEKQALAFMKAVLPELERRPYVARYAWFGAGRRSASHESVRTSRLFEKDGSLSELGRYYANFTWPPAPRQEPQKQSQKQPH